MANGAPGAADLRSSRLSSHASRLSSHAIGPRAPELPRSQIARLEQNSTFSKPATVNFRRGPVRNSGGEYRVAGQAATSQARSGNAADKKISHLFAEPVAPPAPKPAVEAGGSGGGMAVPLAILAGTGAIGALAYAQGLTSLSPGGGGGVMGGMMGGGGAGGAVVATSARSDQTRQPLWLQRDRS
ncbi:hypothetical protein TeGR_g13672 [Tetraparma gracilis]|uniref:Uncharacterized protein n=1 Tax=Tetraparma gracilis TaxID=2962635 RepID=A0ABQ6MXY1_9STRA|nr:hypothetical protein TeGR_g13672 [Tetraparma gracilis]